MAQRFDIAVGQQLGEFIAPVDRQHGRDRVELDGAALYTGEVGSFTGRSHQAVSACGRQRVIICSISLR